MPDVHGSAALEAAVAALPELYQPIFGHPEVVRVPSRLCEDRLAEVFQAVDALTKHLGRPIRVLDLGCAQGYFSLSLAARGADVTGIDLDHRNIAVCNLLRTERLETRVSFATEGIEERVASIRPGEFDLVLGLSVFHHMIHARGIELVMMLLGRLAETCDAGIFEFALRDEPLYWARSQPSDVSVLLKSYLFKHEIAHAPTHLSDIPRPLIYASNKIWMLSGVAGRIGLFFPKAYSDNPLDYNGTRSYFTGDGKLIKIWSLLDPQWRAGNLKELSHEAAFLRAPPADFDVPKLDVYDRNEHEIWIVREAKPGQLLRHLIKAGTPFDSARIVEDVLLQLAKLEAVGKYHDDLRTWNVLVEPNGNARLIDYGAIVDKPTDLVWPHNAYLGVITFIRNVLLRQLEPPMADRMPWPRFAELPQPFDAVLHDWLDLAISDRTFVRLLDLWRMGRAKALDGTPRRTTGFTELLEAVEDRYQQQVAMLEARIRALDSTRRLDES